MINETIDKDQTASPRLDISAETESYLKTSAKWGFFLAVMGYIFIFILVVIGIVLFVISTIKNEYSDFQNLPFHFPFVIMRYQLDKCLLEGFRAADSHPFFLIECCG